MSHRSLPVTRRVFLGTAAATAATAFRPAFARQAPPSDQLLVGAIGVGGMGLSRLRELVKQPDVRIAAICDVDRRRVDRAVAYVEKELGYRPDGCSDFRRLLTRRDIDAVTVVTPDHWHAIPTIRAFEAGKDVFVEKPLSYSVAEGRAMADASLKHRRVTQMGNHIHASSNYRRVVELVQSGALGRVRRVQSWNVFNPGAIANDEPATVPPELDYDFWLGPAPKRPYDPLRSHFTYRHFWDYSGGTFIDFWCHIVDVAMWALDLPAPRSVMAMGGRLQTTDHTETPDTMDALLEYPDLMFTHSLRAAPPPGLEHMGSIGCIFEGTEATLVTNYGTNEVWVKGTKAEDFPRPPETIPDSPGHMREFLDAVKSRSLETSCNLRYGHRLTKLGLLANISYRVGRRIQWDDQRERIVGDGTANRMLSRRFRKPYTL
jgi:predicted dehydrogenase